MTVKKSVDSNAESLKQFRKESWWQIVFPVLLVSALAVAALVMIVVLGGAASASIVADYVLVLLIILGLFAGLITFVIMALLAFLVSKAIGGIPPYTQAAQGYMQIAYKWVDKQTSRIADVVIVFRTSLFAIEMFLRQRGIIPEEKRAAGSEPASAGKSE